MHNLYVIKHLHRQTPCKHHANINIGGRRTIQNKRTLISGPNNHTEQTIVNIGPEQSHSAGRYWCRFCRHSSGLQGRNRTHGVLLQNTDHHRPIADLHRPVGGGHASEQIPRQHNTGKHHADHANINIGVRKTIQNKRTLISGPNNHTEQTNVNIRAEEPCRTDNR